MSNQHVLQIINHKRDKLHPQLFADYANVQHLVIESLTCTKLIDANFGRGQSLETIRLTLPQLRLILPRAFIECGNCTRLRIELKTIRNENFLRTMPQLRHVHIESDGVLQLDRDLFRGNSQLTHVSINAAVAFVRPQLFDEQHQLRYLSLWNRTADDLMFMRLNSFACFVALQTLRVCNAEIMISDFNRVLSKLVLINCNIANYRLNFLQHLPRLQYLNLRNCKQILIQDHFRFNGDLRVLLLSGNFAPSSNLMPELRCLHMLDLSRCVLTAIERPAAAMADTSFGSIVNLNLQMNCLRELFPGSFAGCVHLRVLNLRFNRVQVLSETVFAAVPNLEVLLLAGNKLSMIESKCFANLCKLRVLDLSDNYLEEVKSDWWNQYRTYALENYNLSSNLVEKIEKTAFACLRNLRYLNLSINNIRRLTKQHFRNLRRLVRLNLSVNHIEELNRKCFANLIELRTLNLRKNRLDRLSRKTFMAARQLHSLDLSLNRIRKLDAVFKRNLTLRYVHLYGNKLRAISMRSNFFAPFIVLFVDGDSFAILHEKPVFSQRIVHVFVDATSGVYELHFRNC